MEFRIFNKGGNFKVAFFCRETFGNILMSDENVLKIAEVNNFEIHLLSFDESFIGFARGHISRRSVLSDNDYVRNLYKYSLEYICENNIKISIFFGSGFLWLEPFLEEVKKFSYLACYFADDPEGAEETSRYYVKNFHYAFCGGIFFNKTCRIEEKYREWGARKSKFVPLGACPVKYELPIKSLVERDIEIVYVGGAYLKKILRIFRLKKHFGERMVLYGRGWNYHGNNVIKLIIAKIVKGFYRVSEVEELPNDQLAKLYQRAKIGFNMHISYGPSNQRLYELPMNGVMQVCDCKNGLKELYEIGKEVVTYETINEAIKKIEFYLKNEKERMKIAKAGYVRAKNNYLLEDSFKIIKNEILNDIQENYSTRYLV